MLQVAPWEDDDWKLGVPDQAEKELAAYADDAGPPDADGARLARPRPQRRVGRGGPEYSIGGLPATTFTLALWNATGNGENSLAGTVTTNAVGVARFEVPLHAAFALTTVPVS